jgi:hypothetical protein
MRPPPESDLSTAAASVHGLSEHPEKQKKPQETKPEE